MSKKKVIKKSEKANKTKKTKETKEGVKKINKFKQLPEDQLKIVARDILEDRVFTSSHIRDGDLGLLGMVFMPMFLGGSEQVDLNDLGLIYEYYDKAGPRGINGYPTFFSCRLLCKADSKKVWAYHKTFKEMRDNMLAYVELEKEPETPEKAIGAIEKPPLSS